MPADALATLGMPVAKKRPGGEEGASPKPVGRPTVGKPVNVRIPEPLMDRLAYVEKVLGLDHSNLIRLVLTEQLHIYEARARAVEQAQRQESE